MADHTTNALLGLCNTLTDIVGPGVSADDPLARQELRMAVRYLEFLQERVEHLHERARFEVRYHRDLAAALHDLAGGGAALTDRIARADTLLSSPEATLADLRDCAAELSDSAAEIVRTADDPSPRADVERAVVDASRTLTGFERSWYLPLGMDHFAGDVQSLDTYLGQDLAATTGGRD
jgi:hypothetical protein